MVGAALWILAAATGGSSSPEPRIGYAAGGDVDGPEVRAPIASAVARILGGSQELVDLTEDWAALEALKDLESGPPPSGLPAPIAAAWTEGVGRCELEGAASYDIQKCRLALYDAILNRLFRERRVDRVVRVDAKKDLPTKSVYVGCLTHQTTGTEVYLMRRAATLASASDKIEHCVWLALQPKYVGKPNRKERNTSTELPEVVMRTARLPHRTLPLPDNLWTVSRADGRAYYVARIVRLCLRRDVLALHAEEDRMALLDDVSRLAGFNAASWMKQRAVRYPDDLDATYKHLRTFGCRLTDAELERVVPTTNSQSVRLEQPEAELDHREVWRAARDTYHRIAKHAGLETG